jgi:hypothetical protein
MKQLQLGTFILVLLTMPGCGADRPTPADTELARQTLRTALDAWKKGVTPESLTSQMPPIFVAERDWKKGARLANYEVDPDDQLFGADLRCSVWLTLQDANGKERRKKATYSVGTNNKLTVVREDDE